MSYERARLQRLITMSQKLGFHNETRHWEDKLKQLDEKEKAQKHA